MFILLSVSTLAFIQTSEFNNDQLVILTEKVYSYEKNKNITLSFHIHNSTGGIINNNNLDCNLYMYGSNGSIIYQSNLLNNSNNVDMYTSIGSDVTNFEGQASFNVDCNATNGENGYISDIIYFTNTGRYDENSGFKWFAIIFSITIMTIMFAVLATMIKDTALKTMKIFFFIMSVINTLMLGVIAYMVSLNPYDVISYRNLGLGYASINIISILGFVWFYIGIYRIGGIYKRNANNMSAYFNNKK